MTNTPEGRTVEYLFDGNITSGPLAGQARPESEDIVVLDELARPIDSIDDLRDGNQLSIFFRGAFPSDENPDLPDPATITGWMADISELNGFPLLQFEIRFVLGNQPFTEDPTQDPPPHSVDSIRIRFRIR